MPVAPPGSGFGWLGGLILPISIIGLLIRQPPGPIRRLVRAGATTPETALRATTVGIPRPEDLRPAISRGVVVALSDGRLWVDTRRLRRRRVTGAILIGLALAVCAEGAWLLFRSSQ